MDTARLKRSWNHVLRYGGQVPLFFYSTLFLTHPPLREMFPAGMSAQRDKLVGALGQVVAKVDDLEQAIPFLRQLGRDHRKFAVTPEHYPAVGQALIATLSHFLGDEWTPELEADWTAAYGLVSDVMIKAAQESTQSTPPWWNAEVVRHERRTAEVAVLTLRTDRPISYLPGQSVSVETHLRPRMWRYYSPANTARDDGIVELHVRMIDGGAVSSALVQAVAVGDVLRLGAPVGDQLTLNHKQDIVLIAGGTGLAPLKALLGQVAEEGVNRYVHLFVGARGANELYDMPSLHAFARALPRLRVIPAVSEDHRFTGPRGPVGEVALNHGPWPDQEIYVCGSPVMVADTREMLAAAGIGADRVHFEEFSGYGGLRENVVSVLKRG
ncbi:globin domain-containing protein [Amycolatopsis taiwanensis]|uniref:globin domain-containing protein n=1 Tax=Amycolatopsis taiwanensis TaxID=342230 RepID=UPI000483531E|nr:globin domain-containing protein [Amycolatopsis taiwanensis]